MAEPVIISYAKGLLRQFPGVPEGIVDVIPVDLVVAALIAVAAKGPDPSGPTVYQVASGARNPLQYGKLVDIVENWFTERPLYDNKGQPIVVPKWSFPGRGQVQGQLRRATKALSAAERLVNVLPLRGERAEGLLVSRSGDRRRIAPSAMSSSTAPTRRQRRVFASTARCASSKAWRSRTRTPFASTRA